MSFKDLDLIVPILKALDEEGYSVPTPIQQQSIPMILQQKDLLGCAQTGTGKTAAFAIPLLQQLHQQKQQSNSTVEKIRKIQVLVLTPTRELAIQVGESFQAYGKHLPLKHLVIFGGVSQFAQVKSLERGVDILVATPGRLLDLMNQQIISLRDIKYFVLDEADRMLDMGFIHDVKRIITKLPTQRQTVFFSATMSPEVQALSASLLNDPVKVKITPPATTAERIQQSLYHVQQQNKKALLLHLLKDDTIKTALVFTRTKYGADKICKELVKAGHRAAAIHGNKSQQARQSALLDFRNGKIRLLVATDIAARGIDVDGVTHVFNYEIPNVPETYVHRIGRTGRAGATGLAVSFCDPEEKPFLRDIEKLIRKNVEVIKNPLPEEVSMTVISSPVKQHGINPRNNNARQHGRPKRRNSHVKAW